MVAARRRVFFVFFCLQAEDGKRDLVRSRGLGDVYKRQEVTTYGIKISLCHGHYHSVAESRVELFAPRTAYFISAVLRYI